MWSLDTIYKIQSFVIFLNVLYVTSHIAEMPTSPKIYYVLSGGYGLGLITLKLCNVASVYRGPVGNSEMLFTAELGQ